MELSITAETRSAVYRSGTEVDQLFELADEITDIELIDACGC